METEIFKHTTIKVPTWLHEELKKGGDIGKNVTHAVMLWLGIPQGFRDDISKTKSPKEAYAVLLECVQREQELKEYTPEERAKIVSVAAVLAEEIERSRREKSEDQK